MSEVKCEEQINVTQELADEDAELKDLLDSAFEDLVSPTIDDNTSIQPVSSNENITVEDIVDDKIKSAVDGPSKIKKGKEGKNKKQQEAMISQFEEDMQKFTEALGSTLKSDNNEFDKFLQDPQKVEQMFQDAMKNIADVGKDDVQKLISDLNSSGLNPDGPVDANINESMPQIFNLVQNLLSKELLYPALRDLSPKFDEWMGKNIETLTEEDKERYNGQINLIRQICQTFEDESLEDQERFERNLDLMEKMQSLGAPPAELSMPSDLDNLMMDSVKDKCTIM